MNEIKCPHCKKAFKIDEAGYADILKQVRNQEFDRGVLENPAYLFGGVRFVDRDDDDSNVESRHVNKAPLIRCCGKDREGITRAHSEPDEAAGDPLGISMEIGDCYW